MKSPKWMKRLFLAGLFGAELSSPKTHSKTGFYSPIFSMNKNESFVDNGRMFCIQLMKLLEDFGIRTNKISERKEYRNKSGNTYRIRLIISAEEKNLIKLWSNVGFSYNQKRSSLSYIGILYIKEKQIVTQKREEIAKETKKLKEQGLNLIEVQTLLECDYANKRFIERHYYESVSQRIPLNHISFNEFVKLKLSEQKKFGVLFDSITEITKENFNGNVYDLNIKEIHNFVANNIVVSNCGVRLMRTNLYADDIKENLKSLVDGMFNNVPSGLGSKGRVHINHQQLDDVLTNGARWAVENGYGWEEDLKFLEENGSMAGADPSQVSSRAKQRGLPQLGSLGAGNHFLELQMVDEIFDKTAADKLGITSKDQIMVMIHTGSRGCGYQICDDQIREIGKHFQKDGKMFNSADFKIELPDRQLVCAPVNSRTGENYIKAMKCAANYAWANRQMIVHWVRQSFEDVLRKSADELDMKIVYDVAHNIAKQEEHLVDGKRKTVYVHRKGATRAFGPDKAELPDVYQSIGQPVLIPGDMGTSSYVLVGTDTAMKETFGSTCHGAGRVMSRKAATHKYRGEKVVSDLQKKGIYVKAASQKVVAEEAPGAYKDVDSVVNVAHGAGISLKVARMRPLGVVKG
jgi:tRNA-splicing ligase RtcB